MNTVGDAVRELVGLFVDDGRFGLGILAVVFLAGTIAKLGPTFPLAAGGILLFGCLVVLFVNVTNSGR